jgi:hypothetical protein
MPNLVREKDVKTFSMGCFALTLVSFAMEFFSFPLLAKIISSLACLALLGFYSILIKEFKSAFINIVMASLICNLLGEISLMWDKSLEKYTNAYWAFLILHFVRDLLLVVGYYWNVIKSEIYNNILVKLAPYGIGAATVYLMQYWRDIDEKYYGIFLAFNIISGLMLTAACLRPNHTSDESLHWGIGASALFILSDFLAMRTVGNFGLALRTVMLILGSYGTTMATFDHATHYKIEVKTRVYHQFSDNLGTKLEPIV